ncbi:MAG: ribonuclease PH [Leptolyngbyaceae bacterium]|nr:ribonuclease PH [Leptolyngbyaceae bacterium]
MGGQRSDGRQPNELRPVHFERHYTQYAAGSVLASCGNTKVLCTVTVQPGVPPFLIDSGRGWLTAEYRMLPSATHQRKPRELMKLSGRTQEIQRLIGRSLRAVLDFKQLGERTLLVDADVLQADAGTRTTAITGGYVALYDAIATLLESGDLEQSPLTHQVAAISVGMCRNQPLLDLNYIEDSSADVDLNVVLNDALDIIEIQGTAEDKSFSRQQMNQMLDYAETGIQSLLALQRSVLGLEG